LFIFSQVRGLSRRLAECPAEMWLRGLRLGISGFIFINIVGFEE
jgi:hypothetical protein